MQDFETKYLRFTQVDKDDKMQHWLIINRKHDDILAQVYWKKEWNQYIWNPAWETEFNDTCTQEIKDFISELNKEQKAR